AGQTGSRGTSSSFALGENACGLPADLHFDPLPGARAEVEDVAGLMNGSATRTATEEVLVRTGGDATEEALRRAGSGKTMFHLSTHAFFLDEACPATVGLEVPSEVQGELHQVVLAMPDTALTGLFLSGMALASANHRGETDRGDTLEDGILTAEEISSLDLSGVECVVLSACDTGLGKILPGEGILGLQRAFLEAGARAMAVSLWRVQDDVSGHRVG